MADTILTHDMLAQRALFHMRNELNFAKYVYKGYNREFTAPVGRYRKGATVRVQLPNKFRVKDGATMDKVDIGENSVDVSIDKHKHVAWDFLETDLTLKVEDYAEKYLKPRTIALANHVDADGLNEYKNIYNHVGTPGTTPTTLAVWGEASTRMTNESVPLGERYATVSPATHTGLVNGEIKGLFAGFVGSLARRGWFGSIHNIDIMMDQNSKSHTVGAHGGTPLMNGTTAEGATSLVTDGWTASAAILKQGDVITIAGVVGVNPVSGQAWENDQLRQFVVTADTSADASGDATIPISPKIYSSAAGEAVLPYQTIVTLPANNAAITVVGTASTAYVQNLAYHRDCFALTMVPFRRPASAGQSVMWGQATDKDIGLSIAVATGFDITEYFEATRSDIYYGWDTPRPELGCRITG